MGQVHAKGKCDKNISVALIFNSRNVWIHKQWSCAINRILIMLTIVAYHNYEKMIIGENQYLYGSHTEMMPSFILHKDF